MRSLTDIQTLVRRTGRDSEIVLTNNDSAEEPGLILANKAYRALAALTAYEDFTRVNTDHSTLAATNDYERIFFNPKYLDITLVEVQDQADNNLYKRLIPERSELRWSMVGREAVGMPRVFRWSGNDLEQPIFTVRPAPDTAGLLFRFTGIIEPPPFTDGDSKTLFKTEIMDDVLADWIASYILQERTFSVMAGQVLSSVAQRLRVVTGREVTPEEMRERLV